MLQVREKLVPETPPVDTVAAAAAAPEPPPARHVEAWRTVAVLFAVGALGLLAVFADTSAQIVSIWWNSATFNHGFLILPIVGYLVGLRLDRLYTMCPRPTWLGPALILGLSAVWLLGEVASVGVVQQFMLAGALQALVIGLVGLRVAAALAFPLFYILFAVPFGDFLVPILQDFTAEFTVWMLRLVGIPVFLDGTFLAIPTGNFEVAEACAGVRFLIATVALGFLYANVTYRDTWRRVLFIGLSFAVPIIANGFRAFGIVAIAYATDHRVAVGVDHIIYGWIFFAIVTILLLAIGLTFRERTEAPPAPLRSGVAGPFSEARRAGTAIVAAAVLAGAIGPVYAAATERREAVRPPTLALPAVAPAWRPVAVAPDWEPEFPGADSRVRAAYQDGAHRVDVFVAYFVHQRERAEAVAYDNLVFNNPRTIKVGGGSQAAIVDGAPLEVRYSRLLTGERGRVVWQWYWVDGRYTADPYAAKILQARARLLGGRPEAAVVLVSSPYQEAAQEAAASMQAFLNAVAPFRPVLERVGAR